MTPAKRPLRSPASWNGTAASTQVVRSDELLCLKQVTAENSELTVEIAVGYDTLLTDKVPVFHFALVFDHLTTLTQSLEIW